MMKLKSFSYERSDWHVMLPSITGQNLLVGKNATGKSMIIHTLSEVISVILQTVPFSITDSYHTELVWEEGESTYLYFFRIEKGKVEEERFRVRKDNSEEEYIQRYGETSLLNGETVNAPENKLIIHVRRDTVQFPFIEDIVQWAENVLGFSFNEIDVSGDNMTEAWFVGHKIALYDIINKLQSKGESVIDGLKTKMSEIGYHIHRIQPFDVNDNFKFIFVEEENVHVPLFYRTMSKGMYRALFTLSLLTYIADDPRPSMLLIDDFCEGLDYDRSILLGKYVYGFCAQKDIQLFTSSNDSFLMDVVSLDSWHILQREGSNVEVINRTTNPSLFEDFEFTGLRNFDLFSSDFIARHLQRKGQ